MRLDRDVQQLMRTHGYTVNFSRDQDGGTYDPATGTITGGSTLTWTETGVYVNYMDLDIDGTSVTADDQKLLMQAKGLAREPEVGDFLDDDLRVINVRKIQSGSTVIAYTCQVRG